MRPALLQRVIALAVVSVGGALPAVADDGRYGFYRVVEGTADVLRDGSTEAVQENLPLVTGDRLWTGRGSRAEVVLPDGTVVRVGGDTEVAFDELAASSDAPAGGTLLFLERGELQLLTDETAGVAEYPRVDTRNATVYLEGAGSYRVEAGGESTAVVVRRGQAELVTRRGATSVREGQEAFARGEQRADVARAGAASGLERWGETLELAYRRSTVAPEVDRRIAYSASRMDGYGTWVSVESRRAWRPRVGADWSPYRHGRWVYTPAGMTWVSYEPWGWVPYHYGSWDYAPGWGWVWYPGRAYAPAWVYWYWGPTHVGWVPIGYYYRHYGPRWYGGWGWGWDVGFRFGVHGWAGGRVGYWDRWSFVDCRYFGDRRLSSHTRYAHQLGVGELPRGVIATDTRPLRTAIATRPSEGMRVLANHPTRGEGRELPDVTRFIARDPGVGSEEIRRALPIDRADGSRPTLGGGDRGAVGRGNPGDGGAVGRGAEQPRLQPGGPIATRPRGDEGSGSGGDRGDGGIGSDSSRPQARPRVITPDAPGGGGISARPSTPSRSAPPPSGGGPGTVGREPDDRGAVRVRPSPPTGSGGSDEGRGGGIAVRPSSPVRSAPPADDGGGSAGRATPPPTRSNDGERPQVRPREEPDGASTASQPRLTTGGDDSWRQPGERTGAAPRTVTGGAPPPADVRSRPSSGYTSGNGGVGSRAVPPVRRVVEGVRSTRPETSDSRPGGGSAVTPPSVGSRGGYTPPPATGSRTAAPPPVSRGGYAPPADSSRSAAPVPPPSRGTYSAPPTSRSTTSAPPPAAPSQAAPPAGSPGRVVAPPPPSSRPADSSGSGAASSSRPSRESSGDRGGSRASGRERGDGGGGGGSRARSRSGGGN